MKDLRELDYFRLTDFDRRLGLDPADPNRQWGGAFGVKSCVDAKPLRCIVSAYRPHDGVGHDDFNPPWNHVSVSREKRTPTWGEMEQIKRIFFADDEVAMQLHVAVKDHISNHPFCLHIWQPALFDIPLPPSLMVGIGALGEIA